MAGGRLGNRRGPGASDGSLDSAAVNPARRLVPVDRRHLSYRVGRPDSDDHVPEEYDYGGGVLNPREGRCAGPGLRWQVLLGERTAVMPDMKAAVIREAGGPEVLKIESRAIPTPQSGEALIRVKAFGLNRSELFTRQGHSPGVKFPRVLGIEAVGLVEEAPGNEFQKGDIVATAMGGMGRRVDGGYAEFTSVPAAQVQVVKT